MRAQPLYVLADGSTSVKRRLEMSDQSLAQGCSLSGRHSGCFPVGRTNVAAALDVGSSTNTLIDITRVSYTVDYYHLVSVYVIASD